jgi:molybdopterin synthase sulfur carrier subunit
VSSVRIPPTMRTATSGAKVVDIAGLTVREVVDRLVATYPALAAQLLDGQGAINRFVNVFVNDTDVRHLAGLDTPVDDRDAVVLLPAMAGG